MCVCHFNMLCICSSICPSIYGIYNVSIYLSSGPKRACFRINFQAACQFGSCCSCGCCCCCICCCSGLLSCPQHCQTPSLYLPLSIYLSLSHPPIISPFCVESCRATSVHFCRIHLWLQIVTGILLRLLLHPLSLHLTLQLAEIVIDAQIELANG